MPISTRSSKEELLFYSDPTRLERSIRKEDRISSIDTTSTTSIDTTSTTSIDTTSTTLIDICDRATIDSSTRTLIDTNPRADMVATLVLQRDENGDLHDPEGHLCNAAGQKINGHGDVIHEPSVATEDAKVLRQRTIAEWIRHSQLYTNMRSIQSLEIQGVAKNPAYFSYVGQHSFHGLPHENPLDHIETLEEFVSLIQKHEGTEDYIICKLLKYFISGNAVDRLKLLPPGSLTIWNDVKTAFLTEFFDDAMAA